MKTHAEIYDAFFSRPPAKTAPAFVGVKTTGIFCRQGCPARQPKRDNCDFFETAKAALSAGFRACRRCHPARLPDETTSVIKRLTSLIENDPDRRISETDIKALGIDPSTARRQFKKRFGLTFAQYARSYRLGRGAQTLAEGDKVINAQLTAGYESASGFRSAFSKTFGQTPKGGPGQPLFIDWIDTPLGPMIAICDAEHLYLLEFTVRKNVQGQLARLARTYKRAIVPGQTDITAQIKEELSAYFKGELKSFETPLKLTGTDFQKSVWDALIQIPYGETRSYGELAKALGNPKAFRAVATSNASNGLALIIPCHRVINTGGGLGGYAGGLDKKQWLLDMESGRRALL